jgi:hypothetical protein
MLRAAAAAPQIWSCIGEISGRDQRERAGPAREPGNGRFPAPSEDAEDVAPSENGGEDSTLGGAEIVVAEVPLQDPARSVEQSGDLVDTRGFHPSNVGGRGVRSGIKNPRSRNNPARGVVDGVEAGRTLLV